MTAEPTKPALIRAPLQFVQKNRADLSISAV
jgi:hypothetical protein